MRQSNPAASPQPAALDDKAVIARVLDGEIELFEILMRRYNQRVYRTVRSILSDPAEAEDVAQEAYLKAYDKLASFRGESAFSTWLTKIAVYEALSRQDRHLHLVSDANHEHEPVDRSTSTPETDVANRELRSLLRASVDALPDSLRPVFVLREVEGLSGEDTAAALGISSTNVRVRLHRAKAMLRRHIDQQLGSATRELYAFDGARCDRLVQSVFDRLPNG